MSNNTKKSELESNDKVIFISDNVTSISVVMNEPDITDNEKVMKATANIKNSINSSKRRPESSTITQTHTNKISRSSSEDSDLEEPLKDDNVTTDTKKSSITIEEKISSHGCRDRYSKITSTNTRGVCSKNKCFSSNESSNQSVENNSGNKSSTLDESVMFLYEVSKNTTPISSGSESSDDESLESDIENKFSKIDDSVMLVSEVSSESIQEDSENIKSKRSESNPKSTTSDDESLESDIENKFSKIDDSVMLVSEVSSASTQEDSGIIESKRSESDGESSESDSEDKSSNRDDSVLFISKIPSTSTKACSKNITLCPSNEKESPIEGSENKSFVPDKSAMFVSGVPSAFTIARSKNIIESSNSESSESDSDSEDEEVTQLHNSVVIFEKKRIPKVIEISDSSDDENDDVVFVKSDHSDEIIDLSDETVNTSAIGNFRFGSMPDFIPLLTNTTRKNKRKRNKFFPNKKMKLIHHNGNHSGRTNNNNLKRDHHLNTPALCQCICCFKKKGKESSNVRDLANGITLSHSNMVCNSTDRVPKTGLRPIVIDGANVGRGWGDGNLFRFQNVFTVIDYFKERGHKEIVCFLPGDLKYRISNPEQTTKRTDLENEEIIVYTPARRTIEGAKIKPYDDRFIVQYASERNGIIISNDGYRDLALEEQSWKNTIETSILNFTVARNIIMFPKDPLGRHGPTLDEMLRFDQPLIM